MTFDQIRARLLEISPQYSIVLIPAESQTDAAINVLLCGMETGWSLQVGRGYFGVNEYSGEGDDFGFEDHGTYKTRAQAVDRLCGLLVAAKS